MLGKAILDNLLGIIGILTGALVFLKAWKDYQDRKLAETIAKAKETAAGVTAIAELVKANKVIHEEFEQFRREMKEEERNWEHKFETLRTHCEKVMQNTMD